MMRAPAGPVLTTSELASGQQYVLTFAVAVQLREARAPETTERTKMDFMLGIDCENICD